MWHEDSVDDEIEEESEWQQKEEKLWKTVLGKSMSFILMLGSQGLFGKEVATAMITFSVAAAHKMCEIDVLLYFLAAGLIFIEKNLWRVCHHGREQWDSQDHWPQDNPDP